MSTQLRTADWQNWAIIAGHLAAEVAALKKQYEGDILTVGSGQLVRGLMEEELVDELRLMVFPVVFGTGRRLFAEGSKMTRLELVASDQVGPDGVTVLTYRSVRS